MQYTFMKVTVKKPYRIVLLSEQVQLLFNNWQNLRGPFFTKWKKVKAARTVRFETVYRLKKIKRVITYIEEVQEITIKVSMPPLTNEPIYDHKIMLSACLPCDERQRIKDEIKPIIKRFIKRNY